MSQLTDEELLYRREAPTAVTDPVAYPEWDDATPVKHGRELGRTGPAVTIDGGLEPTTPSAGDVGGTEANAVLIPETNEPISSIDSEALEEQEPVLVVTIIELWSCSTTRKSNLATSRAELAEVRRELGMRLYAYKSLLSHSGRGGKWAGFLREVKIPRATADRLVEASSPSSAQTVNRLSEAISAPTEVDIAQIVSRLMPRLARQLTTPALVDRFLHALGDALHGSTPVAADSKRGTTVVPKVKAAS